MRSENRDAPRVDAAHVILVGLPGVGKTTIGRAVAKRLERSFVDLDDEIVKQFGKSVANIFAEDGEQAFRAAEARVSAKLAEGYRMGDRGMIVAPGGGWVANSSAVAPLRGIARIIYLRVSPAEAVRRMGRAVRRRPLFVGGDPIEIMMQLYESRRKHYEAVADIVIETDGVSREALVGRVVEVLGSDRSKERFQDERDERII